MLIEDLYINPKFNQICKHFGKENSEDLKNDVVLVLLDMKSDICKINNIVEYACCMARNYAINKRSKFSKQYLIKNDELTGNEIVESEYNFEFDYKNQFVINYINETATNQNSQYFFHCILVKKLIELKSLSELSRKTKIPYRTLSFSMSQLKLHIKELCEKSVI